MYHLAVLAVVYETVPDRMPLPVEPQLGPGGRGGRPPDLTYRALFHDLALHSELTEHVIAVLDDIRSHLDHTLGAGTP